MYKSVKTNEELVLFNQILAINWLSENYHIEIADGSTDCYLFQKGDDACGTLEVKPFDAVVYADLLQKKVEDFADFTSENTIEVDKLSILKKYQKDGILAEILYVISTYAKDKNHCVALIAPKLLLGLRGLYGLTVHELGEKFMFKGAKVVPVYFDLVESSKKLEEQGWFAHACGLQHAINV